MQKLLAKCRKANAGPTDQQTDRPTDRQTDIVPYRVALQATKKLTRMGLLSYTEFHYQV